MIVKKITVGIESRIEASEVADHQNDLGKDLGDRKVVYIGEGKYSGNECPEEWAPIFFVAIATTEETMKEILSEFYHEVPILLDIVDAPENVA